MPATHQGSVIVTRTPSQPGIGPTLLADGRSRAVTGVNDRLGWQRHQHIANATHQRVVVAARQVGSSDALSEKHITVEHNACNGFEKANVTWCVTGCKEHLQLEFTDLNGMIIREFDIRFW